MKSVSPPLALVTGATSSIGRDLAGEFAAHDFHVVLVANDPTVHDVAADLPEATAIQLDLAVPANVDSLAARVGVPTAMAINADTTTGGSFSQGAALEDHLATTDLNVRATIHLTKRLLPGMIARAHGRLLFTSSGATNHPVHNATKAFVQSFAGSLRDELLGTGLTVTALAPESHSSTTLASRVYAALMAGRPQVAPPSPLSRITSQIRIDQRLPAVLRFLTNARA
ncbi:SDR family NAD(P)-dependent oxidoreductase [Actinokineospora globicatena]|uniref:Short-chain dehydrogenase n=1 Tax=Actinokineospora globicatena TaxID=103729 RepID=A0A9W6V993_9PSEU|nr:SDR family NAD(P)-dependent oxidoreductase [Actinokineospora globicatena]GLW90738.1 hypothetical protein Aglo03_15540 [Actinokineospora globicatena]